MSVFLVLFLCVAVVTCQEEEIHQSSHLENDGRTVLLGGLFPLHHADDDNNCGPFWDTSVQQVEAMVFAINTINSDPSILPNITLAYSIRDTCSNPSYGLEQAFQFVQDRNVTCSSSRNKIAVSGVVGAYYSRVSMDVANLLRLHRIPQISHISTADILSDKLRFEYFFRTVPPDSLQARAIADIIFAFNWTYVFALYSDDSYGNGGIAALMEELNGNEYRICTAETIALPVQAKAVDFDSAVERMSAEWVRNASVAVLFGHLDAAEGIMEALLRAKNQSIGDTFPLDNLTWIGTDSWGDTLPDQYHHIARGMLSVIPRSVESEAFDSYFTSLHPSNHTNNTWFNQFWESRFNCSLAAPMSCDLDNESITLNTTEHKQITQATLIIDAVMAFAHALDSLISERCTNGVLCEEVLVERLTGTSVDGELIRGHLYNVSFLGASSNNVSFDEMGDEHGAYFVKNLQEISQDMFSFEIIGSWDHVTGLNIPPDAVIWVTGDNTAPPSYCSSSCNGGQEPKFIPISDQQCCWTCSACQGEKGYSDGASACTNCNDSHMPSSDRIGCVPIPISFLTWLNEWAIVLITVTNIGLVATVVIILVLVINCKHRVVKASSREVTAILLTGVVLCYLMPYWFVVKPSDAVCAIRRFGVGFSFSVCFSALLVKTIRIHRLFNQKSLNPLKAPRFTGPLSQVLMTAIFISFQVGIAVVWLSLEPPSTRPVFGTRSAELRCGESPIIGLSVTLGYNFFLLLLSTYFAFRARKVPENFNEARYINITLYTLCIIWLAFIPTYFITANFGAVYQTTSLTIAIILSATTTLLCLFVPKMLLLFSQKKEDRRQTENTHTVGTGL